MTRNKLRSWAAILLWSLCCLAVIPWWLMRATQAERLQLKSAEQKLKEMSADERSRLGEVADAYRRIRPEDREDLRKLHRALSQDNAESQRLREVMSRYLEWTRTLAVADFERLEAAAEFERFVIVRELLAAVELEDQPAQESEGTRDDWAITLRELDRILTLVSADLSLSAVERARLRSAEWSTRQFLILMYAIRKAGESSGPPRWPEPRLARRIVREVENERLVTVASRLSDDRLAVLMARQLANAFGRLQPMLVKQLVEEDATGQLSRFLELPQETRERPAAGLFRTMLRRDWQRDRNRAIAEALQVQAADVERVMRWFVQNSRRTSRPPINPR